MSAPLMQLRCPECKCGRCLWSLKEDNTQVDFLCADCGTAFIHPDINEMVQRVKKEEYTHGYEAGIDVASDVLRRKPQ